MKLNFSLHFRTFMTGAIIFLSLVILLISLPEGEYSIFEDIPVSYTHLRAHET